MPAAIITHEKKFPVAKTLFMTRYVEQIHSVVKVLNEPDEATADEDEGWPLVNNLIDTGATVKETRRILLNAHFAWVSPRDPEWSLVVVFTCRALVVNSARSVRPGRSRACCCP